MGSISLPQASLWCRESGTQKIKKMKLKKIASCIALLLALAKTVIAADTLTVMIVATPAAITKMGGPQAAELKVYTEINNINQAFLNSRIAGYVKIVRT